MDAQRCKPKPLFFALCFLCLLLYLPSAALAAEVTLSWTQPDDDRVTGYNIYYGQSGTDFQTSPDQNINSPDQTSTTISGLTDGQTYNFAATSFDADGNESDFSETISYTVESSSPDPNDIDDDGDGYTENQGDCNDSDASIYPGATEICGDGIDQDCNGTDLTCPEDIDNDGDGYTENQGDCNDNDAAVYPGAEEICGDGIDQNCDGSDPMCTEIDGVTLSWTRPDDDRVVGYNLYCGETGSDFKASPYVTIDSAQTTSYTFTDLQSGVEYAFAATSRDADGNESDFSETITYTVQSSDNTDTDTQTLIFGDTPSADHPGTIQDTFINVNDAVNVSSEQLNTYTWPENMPANAILLQFDLADLPADAQIQSATLSLYQMEAGGDASYDVSAHKIINHNPDLYHANGYTYDSSNAWTANDTCFSSIPLAQADIAAAEDINTLDQSTGYKDWTITNLIQEWIDNPDSNYGLLVNSDTTASSDSYRYFAACETTDAAQRPQLEVTYTISADDIDQDGDGYSVNDGDCNDNDPAVHPDAPEICGDGIDQDCSGSDLTCPEDVDNDGDGYTETQGDCNDNDAAIHPDATEICGDGIDQNCSGSDETCPEDIDDDGDGYTENQGDCNDNDPSIHPDAPEICGDGIDQDCSGSDLTCPEDVDNDGDGYTENQGDCNDNDASIHPDAAEICGDGIDQNCSGSDETCPEDIDNDGDGFTENEGDCNDQDATVFPGATEICGDGIDQDCDGSDLECLPEEETAEFNLETAEIQIDHEWQTVSFSTTFENPVVVAKPMSVNGGQPAVIRINNVTPEGFEIRVQEWEYLDGGHAFEKVSYLAIEAGRHELPSGIHVEAGTFETSSTQTVSFNQPFNYTPVLISGVTTENGANAVTGRLYNISKEGFDCTLQEQESNAGHNALETLSYIAWEPSAGTVKGMDYTVDSTFDEVTHDFYNVSFYPAFDNTPAFLADMQTRDGGDTANIRWRNKTSEKIEVQVDEEQSHDSETDHTTEAVGYMAFDPASAPQTLVFGDTPDADHPGTLQDTFINLNEEVNASSEQLNTYTWPQDMPANAILLKPDLSGLPAGAQIQSATLSLYQTEAGGDTSYDVSAHKIINHNPDLHQATGYTYDSANAWTANNTCYNSIPLAQADIAPAEDVNTLDQSPGYKQWDVTGMTRDWAENPTSNYGLLLNSDTVAASDSYRFFASTEATDAAQRPRLTITYTISTDDIDQDGDGYTVNHGDCNDNAPSIHPGAPEICGDGIDQDCNGNDKTCPEDIDNDGDGFTENEGDCNDNDAAVYPGAPEVCGDGIDQNCSGTDELCPTDIDNDGDGYTENEGDCNDNDPSIHPGAEEVCGDGIDQNCDGADLECEENPWWWWFRW